MQPKLSMVAQAYNLSYLGGLRSRAVQAKSSGDSISNKRLGIMVHACHPSYVGKHKK
jgi:hypothetical protein